MKPDELASAILDGYREGSYPMADDRGRIGWFNPDPRAILELDALHVPRSLMKTIKRKIYEIRVDTSFRDVIEACAGRSSTWISRKIIEALCILHERGLAHSVEAWTAEGLCGGLYGTALGGAFFGESMFALRPDASKVCMVALVERLRERGFVLLDCQAINPNTARFGAIEIPRAVYLQRLAEALKLDRRFLP